MTGPEAFRYAYVTTAAANAEREHLKESGAC